MKLSAAIEKMIVTGVFNQQNEFMCLALRDNGLADLVTQVEDMVYTVHPTRRRGYPLSCALHDAGIFSYDNYSNEEMHLHCKQLYCWWVFDLKRKGL